jgi:hypothetical protein
VRKKADHILDDSDRLSQLPSDSLDIGVANVTLLMLNLLQHLGNPSSDLSFNERFHDGSVECF